MISGCCSNAASCAVRWLIRRQHIIGLCASNTTAGEAERESTRFPSTPLLHYLAKTPEPSLLRQTAGVMPSWRWAAGAIPSQACRYGPAIPQAIDTLASCGYCLAFPAHTWKNLVIKKTLVLVFALASLATTAAFASAAAAQDTAPTQSQAEFVSGLLTADDLAHVEPVSTEYRRQLLRVELDILIELHALTLTEAEQTAVIDAWLALLPPPPAELTTPDPTGSKGQIGTRSNLAPRSSGERPPSDTGYRNCSSRWVTAVAVTYGIGYGSYDTIHLDPSWLGSVYASVDQVYTGMYLCMHAEQHITARVRSWQSIKQQIACHQLGWFAGTGATWDLEGYRGENPWWGFTVFSHRCNW